MAKHKTLFFENVIRLNGNKTFVREILVNTLLESQRKLRKFISRVNVSELKTGLTLFFKIMRENHCIYFKMLTDANRVNMEVFKTVSLTVGDKL